MRDLEAEHCDPVAESNPGSETADDGFAAVVVSNRIGLVVAELLSAVSVYVKPGDDRFRSIPAGD